MDHSGIRTSARRRKGSVANNNASVGAEKENDQVYETNRMEIDSEEAHPPQHKLDTAALKQHSYASDSSGSSEPESDDDDDDENFEISVSPSKPSHSVTRLPRKQQSIQALDSDSLTSGQLIYDQLVSKGAALKLIIDEWAELFSSKPDDALLLLLNTIIRAGSIRTGLAGLRNEDGDGDPAVLLGTFQDALDAASLGVNMFATKKKAAVAFQHAFQDFWSKWAQTLLPIESGIGFIEARLLPWLTVMSASQFRPLREAASVASFYLLTGLGRGHKDLSVQLERATKLTRTGTTKLASVVTSQVAGTERIIQGLFSSIFIQRFRDVDPTIREAALESLGKTILSNPSLFLDNHYLRYLGWGLSDRSPQVRRISLEALLDLYSDPARLPSMDAFTDRFRPRILEMAEKDIELAVRKDAYRLVARFLDSKLVEVDDLEFMDFQVQSLLPLCPQAVPLLIFRLGLPRGTLPSPSDTVGCLCAYWERLNIRSPEKALVVAEHLVSLLHDQLPSMQDLMISLLESFDATGNQSHLVLLEAVCRAFVYPPAMTMTGLVIKPRVMPTRPTGLAKSIELVDLIGTNLLTLLGNIQDGLDDPALIAIYDLYLLIDATRNESMCEGLCDAAMRLYEQARLPINSCKNAIRVFNFLRSIPSVSQQMETQCKVYLQRFLSNADTGSFVKTAHLMVLSRLPAEAVGFPENIYDALRSNPIESLDSSIRAAAMLQILYQELLWRMIDSQTGSNYEEGARLNYDAIIPLRDEILSFAQMACTINSPTRFQSAGFPHTSLLIALDLLYLFGPEQADVPETWKFNASHPIDWILNEVEAFLNNDTNSDLEKEDLAKLPIGLVRLVINGYINHVEVVMKLLGRWLGRLEIDNVLLGGLDLIKSRVQLAHFIPTISSFAIAQVDAGHEQVQLVCKNLAAYLKRASGLFEQAKELRSMHSALMLAIERAISETQASRANALSQAGSIFVPLLPPFDDTESSLAASLQFLKRALSKISGASKRYEATITYMKAVEKHLSKATKPPGTRGARSRSSKLQLTPQKRSGSSLRLHSTSANNLADMDSDGSGMDNEGTLLEEGIEGMNLSESGSSSPALVLDNLESDSFSDAPMIPLRKKTILRS